MPQHDHIFWMVVESNHSCYISLGNYTISAKQRLNFWGKSEAFSTSTVSSLVFTIPYFMGPTIFVCFYLPLILFIQFIMVVGCIFHVNSIKFTFRIVLGTPIPILSISGNLIPWFLYSPIFKIVKSLKIILVGVPYFSVGAGLGYVTSYYLNCFNYISFLPLT